MKGKRYTTEEKLRIPREADRGERSILNICQEANISEVTFHRWKKQFGHMRSMRPGGSRISGAGEHRAQEDAQEPCVVIRMRWRRKAVWRGVSTGLPARATHRNHVWTWDFIADATIRGGALKLLTILDEHTRECYVLWADRALKAQDVLRWLQTAVAEQGAPEYLRSDNGPELIARQPF